MSNMPVNPPSWRNDTVLPLPNEVKANAWAVDAACSGNPGPMEYQCIDLQTGAQVFHYGPIHGTNNIGEFLAIVHALALMDQKGITDKVIYSDSVNAQLWVNKKQCKTKLERTPQTEQLYQVIARAENWLRTHPTSPSLSLSGKRKKWGEIPADFGSDSLPDRYANESSPHDDVVAKDTQLLIDMVVESMPQQRQMILSHEPRAASQERIAQPGYSDKNGRKSS